MKKTNFYINLFLSSNSYLYLLKLIQPNITYLLIFYKNYITTLNIYENNCKAKFIFCKYFNN